jgi:hypothetical protein
MSIPNHRNASKGNGLAASAAALQQNRATRLGRVAISGAAFSIIGIATNSPSKQQHGKGRDGQRHGQPG